MCLETRRRQAKASDARTRTTTRTQTCKGRGVSGSSATSNARGRKVAPAKKWQGDMSGSGKTNPGRIGDDEKGAQKEA